ncbi:MAG TPA: glycosyltransferase family 2 protein [Casimicrobiaceae bacterium]|jgi:glycosyltransferase involved in cell wall biosynthesis|nr:glycosyltransferase family 2 protein [Casimicrobiaceae bacterium]
MIEVAKISPMTTDVTRATLRIAVIVPCRNEALTIAKVITDFRRELPAAEIWVCDNRSTDETAASARTAGAHVIGEDRPGKGHAVRRLFAAANADIYVLVDGDATYDPKSVHRMVDCLQSDKLDMVIGRRVTTPAEKDSAYRRGHQLGNRSFATAISKLFGYQLEDVFSGYRVFSRRFVRSFPALSTGFEIETEFSVHALDLALPIREIDCPYGARPDGSSSKLNTYRDGTRIALMLIYLFEQVRPALFFGLLGGLIAVVSLALGIPVVIEFMHTGLVPRLPTAVLASALMLLAVLTGACGIILDSVGRGRKEAKRLAYLAAASE